MAGTLLLKGSRRANAKPKRANRIAITDVMTLAETAIFLRTSEDNIVRMVTDGVIPGRIVGEEWRFWRQSLVDWLCERSPQRLMRHAGAAKDDPAVDQMVSKIYRRRAASAMKS